MSVAEIKALCAEYRGHGQRPGQSLSNAVSSISKTLFILLMEEDADPFYDDGRIAAAWTLIEQYYGK